jgi:hypothetical protein
MAEYEQYIDFLSACLIPLIATVTIYIAYQQYRISRLKQKQELFDKRWAVYQTVMETLDYVMHTGNTNNNQLLRFNIARNNGYFFFGEKVDMYLNEMYDKLVDLQEMNTVSVDEQPDIAKRRGELKKWFYSQISEAKKLFSKFLKIDKA